MNEDFDINPAELCDSTCFLSTGIFFQEIKKGSYLSGKCIYQGHANST
jgi:hypothetical protein